MNFHFPSPPLCLQKHSKSRSKILKWILRTTKLSYKGAFGLDEEITEKNYLLKGLPT